MRCLHYRKMILRDQGKQPNKSKVLVERGKNKRERETNTIKFLTQLIKDWGKAKWSKTWGEYSMGSEVQGNSELTGVPLEKEVQQ